MAKTHKGACLCGAVTYEAELLADEYHVCHCATCRQWGAPGMAAMASSLKIENDTTVKHHASSEHAERAFCAECGGHLYWRMKDGSHLAVFIGTLENSDVLHFATQFFVDKKPASYTYANDTAMVTGEELLAAFS